MSIEKFVTLLVLLGIAFVIARDILPPSLTMCTAVMVLIITRVIPTNTALAGFSSPALMTVAALLIIARAVEKTGVLQPILEKMIKTRETDRNNLFRLLFPVASASAFLNNTPIVAMLIGPVQSWADQRGRSASTYLMPISFATSLGGMITLLGTSTNLVVSTQLTEIGFRSFSLFEFARIGLPVAIVGILFLSFATPVLLPQRMSLRRLFEAESKEYTIEMDVDSSGVAVGRTVAQLGLRHLDGVFLAWIRRKSGLVTPVAPEETLQAGDRLGFVGSVNRVVDLQHIRGIRAAAAKHADDIGSGSHAYFEAVVAAISPLVGETLRTANFREVPGIRPCNSSIRTTSSRETGSGNYRSWRYAANPCRQKIWCYLA